LVLKPKKSVLAIGKVHDDAKHIEPSPTRQIVPLLFQPTSQFGHAALQNGLVSGCPTADKFQFGYCALPC
jgi:hypothetical protein